MNRRHQQSMARATASLMDLMTQAQSLQNGVMRQASEADMARLRAAAYSHLDAYLDHMSAAATAIRDHVATDSRPEAARHNRAGDQALASKSA